MFGWFIVVYRRVDVKLRTFIMASGMLGMMSRLHIMDSWRFSIHP